VIFYCISLADYVAEKQRARVSISTPADNPDLHNARRIICLSSATNPHKDLLAMLEYMLKQRGEM